MPVLNKSLIKKIKRDILNMVVKDQAQRYANKLSTFQDKINTNKLKKIIYQIGWPKISQVGKEASDGAWLILQHSVNDLVFQKKCLKLIKSAAEEHEIDAKLLPLLEDRILVSEGRKQIYGTQFYKDKKTGKLFPKPIRNKRQVNRIRAKVGLESIEKYSKMLNEMVVKIEKGSKK